MTPWTHRLRRFNGRALLKATGVAMGAVATVPVAVAVVITALDWLNRSDRKEPVAPQPGTFEAEVESSKLRIYTSGGPLYDDMLAAIDGAEQTVYLKAYIWKSDEVGQQFIDTLNRAAARGVQVFVLYDGFANLVVPRAFFRQFSSQIRAYRLPAVLRRFWKGPLRFTGVNHSKIMVVDDHIGFVGGYNFGSHYVDHWRDTHVREIGPEVWGLHQAMARTWNEVHPPKDHIPWVPPRSWNSRLNVVANLPVRLVYPIRQMYLNAIDRAQDHVWLTTPYFIPDQQILEALLDASHRGVDVRVMIPKESNHPVADWVSRGFYGQLLDAGVTLLLYSASMLHAKTATIDGEWSTVGTANIDRLSLSFSYETNLEVIDQSFAAEMERIFIADAEHCEVIDSPQWRDRHPMARAVEAALVPLRPIL